jgi:hypothetical protein
VDDNDSPTPPVGGDASILKSTKLKVAVVVWMSELLVPVKVRLYSPADVALQETDAVPDSCTLGGRIEPQVNPKEGVSVRSIQPRKELIGFTTIIDTADWLTLTAVGERAVNLKSGTGANLGRTGDVARDDLLEIPVDVIGNGRMISVRPANMSNAADLRDRNCNWQVTALDFELDKGGV